MLKTCRIWRLPFLARWGWVFFACSMFCGCAAKQVNLDQIYEWPHSENAQEQKRGSSQKSPAKTVNLSRQWKKRVMTEKEIQTLGEKDPRLDRLTCLEILARLNGKASYYIAKDIKKKCPLKVPNDFHAFRYWSPLPDRIEHVRHVPKFILVVKNIPFIGWYEKGKLVGDTITCIGKKPEWTRNGLYKVEEKDASHVSQSYPNAYGRPAAMPLALKVYGNVWIHAGDVVGGYSSHGCINLPLSSAEELFRWADKGTPVLITDSLKNIQKDLKGTTKNKPPPSVPQKSTTSNSRG